MSKNTILLISVIFLFVIGAAASNGLRNVDQATMSCCCCKGDSCPMKGKDAAPADTKSCGDNCDCCKGDSCPMKGKDAAPSDTKSCGDNCDCCKGDSCPMKMKHDQKDGMTMPMASDKGTKASDSKACDCSCCQHAKDAKTQS